MLLAGTQPSPSLKTLVLAALEPPVTTMSPLPSMLMPGQNWMLGTVNNAQLTCRDLPTLRGVGQAILYLTGETDWRIYGYRPSTLELPYPSIVRYNNRLPVLRP